MFINRLIRNLMSSSKNSRKAKHNQNDQEMAKKSFKKSLKLNKKLEKCTKPTSPSSNNSDMITNLFSPEPEEIYDTPPPVKEQEPSTTHVQLPLKAEPESLQSTEELIVKQKPKPLSRRTPIWLKFSKSQSKSPPKSECCVSKNTETSGCRPGMLYSDVLFRVGGIRSVPVKVKHTIAQIHLDDSANINRLNKSLSRKISSDMEADIQRELEVQAQCVHQPDLSPKFEDNGKNVPMTNISPPETETVIAYQESGKNRELEDLTFEPDLEIDKVNNEKLTGSEYIAYQIKHIMSDPIPAKAPGAKLFTLDIEPHNFLKIDCSPSGYPRFSCQFDDQHYLGAEKLAMLGLKLALGNNQLQGTFRF